MNNLKNVNREVFQGSDMISLRLRAAKKPAILNLLDLAPEEIEIEPEMIEPVLVSDVEVVSIEPMVVPTDVILPWEDDEPAPPATGETPPPPPSPPPSSSPPPPLPPSQDGSSSELPLFGVGWMDSKPRRRR